MVPKWTTMWLVRRCKFQNFGCQKIRNMGYHRNLDMEKKNGRSIIKKMHMGYAIDVIIHIHTYIYIYIIAVILDDFFDIDQIRQHRISKISCRGEPGYECCARLASPDGGTFFIIFRRRMDDFWWFYQLETSQKLDNFDDLWWFLDFKGGNDDANWYFWCDGIGAASSISSPPDPPAFWP